MRRVLLSIFAFLLTAHAFAQAPESVRRRIAKLCSAEMAGRGYVDSGALRAANYLAGEMEQIGLEPLFPNYLQAYSFPVNTHPGIVSCSLNGKALRHGKDFLLAAACPSVKGEFRLRMFDPSDSLDRELLELKIRKGFAADEALVLRKAGRRSFTRYDSMFRAGFAPPLLVYTEEKKMTHTVAGSVDPFPTLILMDSVVKNAERVSISAEHEFLPAWTSCNVAGMKKFKKADSFIVFTAHFDHLGKQGEAMFPGASDNASGTAMVLHLAEQFMLKKRLRDNIVFILFSGEEAGLLGSEFFTDHPPFDLNRIKILINIDIMGSAENGITVVNGETFRAAFDRLKALNDAGAYLPEVRIRGKARNSDHHHFSEKGVPSLFIYSMGGPGYYHDVFDTAESLPMSRFNEVTRLLLDFTATR